MREQRQSLKDVGDSPFRSGDIDSNGGIEEDIAARGNLSFVRQRQTRDAIQQSGFAGSGSSKQDGDSGRNFDGNIKDERGDGTSEPLFADSRDEHGGAYFAVHGVHARRLTA